MTEAALRDGQGVYFAYLSFLPIERSRPELTFPHLPFYIPVVRSSYAEGLPRPPCRQCSNYPISAGGSCHVSCRATTLQTGKTMFEVPSLEDSSHSVAVLDGGQIRMVGLSSNGDPAGYTVVQLNASGLLCLQPGRHRSAADEQYPGRRHRFHNACLRKHRN